jgi:exodeoxyribonuclease VII small subunit
MSKNDTTISDKLAALQGYVEWFEGEDFSIEQSLEKFNEAEKLAAEVEQDLQKLKNEVVVLNAKFE